ncbi:MAG: gliding motility-associated C-terminal domain-containing protein [Saprospiraceae bacterium]|nr:gliding motility-associated C-terminal domain-containing protein [Saprospiraceae bacterium]
MLLPLRPLLLSCATFLLTSITGTLNAQCPEITSSTLTSPDCFNGSTPCDLCPGDMILLHAEGQFLPDNGCLNWYYSTTPGFNPYLGGGTLIDCGDIDSPLPPPCDVCPEILAIWIDACGSPESANEFMIIHSGSGFNVDNLGLDYDPSNNNVPPGTDDVNVNGGSCSWMVPSATVISNMQASASCDGSNVIPAGPGTVIPPGALVVIWTSANASTAYSFENLCAAGETIYVMQSSCVRAAGAFSNSSSSGLRTTTISLNNCGCSNSITHDTDNPALLGDGDYAYVDNGNVTYGNDGCGNPQAPDVSAPDIMAPISTVADVSFTIPSALCNGGPYYVVGIISPLAGGCSQVFTEEFSFNVLCPDATASVSGITCETNTVTLMATGGSTYNWSGPDGFTSSNQNPMVGPLTSAKSGTYSVTVTNASGCSDEASVGILVFPGISASVDPALPAFCPGGSVILTANGLGGNGTYSYNWVYPGGTGNAGSVEVFQTGSYSVTVTDGNGCSVEVSGIVQAAPGPVVTITPDPAVICGGGSIDLTASAIGGSGGGYIYVWTDPAMNQPTGPVITASQSGSYSVTVTDSDGCTGTQSTTLTVQPNPTVSIAADPLQLCAGASSTLTATGNGGGGNYTFAWNTPGGPTTGNPISATQTGTYTVTLTDGAGCTGADTITLQPGSPLAVTINPDPASFCPGGMVNLSVTVTGDQGNPLAYNWSTPSGPGTGQPLPASIAGSYVVTVTETNGCSGIDSVTVQELANLTITFAQDTVSFCPGGQAQLIGSANGGNGSYTYTWSFTGGTSMGDTLMTNQEGTYTLSVVDGAGCSGQDSAVVIQATSFPVSIVGASSGLCAGDSLVLTTTPTPGPNWSIQWTTPAGPNSSYPMIALTSGMYQVTLSDPLGCSGSAQTLINPLTPPSVQISPAMPTICPGGATTLSANVTAGGPPTAINWLTPQGPASGPTVQASLAGTYIVVATNAAGCTSTDTVHIISGPGISLSFLSDTFAICGGGTIMLSPNISGGTGPYMYTWTTPQGMSNFDTIPATLAGLYEVMVTDVNGCSGMASTTLVISTQLNVNILPIQPGFCPGDSILLTATVAGGVGSITYLWSTPSGPGSTDQFIASIGGGYSVNVVDGTGCTGMATTTVSAYVAPTVMITPSSATLCSGQVVGLKASGSGGSAPYSFIWSGPGGTITGDTLDASQPGSYLVMLTDDHGCTDTISSQISQAPPINVAIDPPAPSICNGSEVAITASASGGTGPYTYQWTGPGWTSNLNPAIATTSGAYTVVATDIDGCTGNLDFNVQDAPGLTVTLQTSADTICMGQTFTALAQVLGGTTPYSYSWATPAGTFVTDTILLDAPGTLHVTVTDANGCSGMAQKTVVSGGFDLVINTADASCPGIDNGSIQILGLGTAVGPVELSINMAPPTTLANLPFQVSDLSPGGYDLVATDLKGCTSAASLFIGVLDEPEVLFNPNQITLIRGDEVVLTPVFNFSPSIFNWAPGTALSCTTCTTPVAGPENTTTYVLTATDPAGCEAVGEVTVIVVGNTRIYLTTAFSPNDDGINDWFYIQSADPDVIVEDLRIYDRWGNALFISTPGPANQADLGWNGKFRGKHLNPGVYIYTVLIRYPDGGQRLYRGDVTLVK